MSKMKQLRDVAKVYKEQALRAINPGVPFSGYKTGSSKAFKTGKMYKDIAGSNRIQTMVSEDKRTGKITFKFNFQTPDYAKYVQFGTRKMKARPFAQLAAQSQEFIQAKDKVIAKEANELLDDIFSDLDKIWEAGGDNLRVS